MVPESHEITFTASPEIKEYLDSPEFTTEMVDKLNHQYGIECSRKDPSSSAEQPNTEGFVLSYTRNDAGGLKDAIDFLIAGLVVKGLDTTTVKGNIPRPKSDSFEDSLPYFESKLLHRKDPIAGTDSPTRSAFENATDGVNEHSGFFAKFRRPGMSSFTSLIDRRKNGGGTNSPASGFFKHASSNASKASLASIESQGSGYRNWWNDSAINLPEEDSTAASTPHPNGPAPWPVPATPLSHANHFGVTSMASAPHSPFPMFGNGSTHSLGNGTTPGCGLLRGVPPHPIAPGTASNGGVHGGLSGGLPGDATPTSRYDARQSVDSGRPSTSHSLSGYPGSLMGLHR
jgi:hypothetical protein